MQTPNVSAWKMQQLQHQQRIWMVWVNQHWQRLVNGEKITAPVWLAMPADAGFEAIEIAHPVGQARDWGLPLSDNSRIHVHEYADGRRVVHRDVHNPKRGLGPMLAHLMQETPYGALALCVGMLYVLSQASNG
jgi:hypothetical protein